MVDPNGLNEKMELKWQNKTEQEGKLNANSEIGMKGNERKANKETNRKSSKLCIERPLEFRAGG